jgi:hypothetical protein
VNGRQGMLTPPRHLIPPLLYPKVHVYPILKFVFATEIMRLMTARYLCFFIRHFNDISEGRLRPDHKGRNIVGSGSKRRNSTAPSAAQPVKVNLVTPLAQAVEMAKSQLKREQKLLEH